MNGLSLFSGAGIGEVVFRNIIPGYRTVGYVEWDDYCQRVLKQRIADGVLDDAPIYGDIRTFISEGFAERYSGMVDWLSGGPPCQPFSVAGRRHGAADDRNMWPATRDAIGIIRPRYVFLENVPGLLATEYIWTILADLARLGYDCEWDIVGAGHFGAPYRRHRLWVFGSVSGSLRTQGGWQRPIGAWPKQQFEGLLRHQLQLAIPAGNNGRVAIRDSNRMDRLKALGNGWVPQVVKTIIRVTP